VSLCNPPLEKEKKRVYSHTVTDKLSCRQIMIGSHDTSHGVLSQWCRLCNHTLLRAALSTVITTLFGLKRNCSQEVWAQCNSLLLFPAVKLRRCSHCTEPKGVSISWSEVHINHWTIWTNAIHQTNYNIRSTSGLYHQHNTALN